MNLTTQYMTRNDCYTANRKITPKGIMVHSTATPGVMAAGWFSRWNKSYKAGETDRQVCVHAFVDDTGVWQYLPWDHRGWHGGGSSNDTHIGFEICEPAGFSYGSGSTMVGYDTGKNEAYFKKAWQNAVELCAMLCQKYGLNETHIICHSEGYKKGIASNHGDVMHWFPKHGENMDTFRAAVKKALTGNVALTPVTPPASTTRPTLKRGSTGEDVLYLQKRLCAHNYTVLADGSFGPDTEDKVRKFQAARKLAVDGVCGPQTWAALEASAVLTREECRDIIQSKCGFSDPAAVWVALETHKYADDLYRKLASVMR